MIKNILKNINIKNISNEKYLIIGCSAGPDSMALLHYLKNNTNNQIICAHINHNIRKESKEEEQFLKQYCSKKNIIFESITLKNYTKNNFESEARTKRYNFYQKVINKYKAKYLFLAHHGDDLIETIIMKISRGSNLEGYAGIKEISKRNNYYIIRPLLYYTKEDILEYNKNNNIKYFIDKSNYDEKYTRNRIRKNILPALKQENKNIHKQFLKYSQTLIEYNNYINKEINTILKDITKNNYILLDKFKKTDPFLQKNIIYKILNNYYNNTPNILTEKHIQNILNLINNPKPNLTINLPHNTICHKSYNKLYLTKQITSQPQSYQKKFVNNFQLGNITIKKITNIEEDGNNICRLNSKNIKLPLYIRNRINGDYIEIKGLNGKKKIKDIFIDNKIDKEKRQYYPILVDSNNTILWIPNLKKSKFNAKKDEFCDIILKYCEKEEYNE